MKKIIHNLRSVLFSIRSISATISGVIVAPFILWFSTAFAATDCGGKLCNPLKPEYSDFSTLIGAVLKIIVQIGTPIAALFFVYAGFTFVTSQGDPKKLDTAKSMFLWTCVGTALIVGAQVILMLLQNTISSITS